MTRDVRSEGGFTVVESLVALVLAVMVFVALSASLGAALRGSRENRFQQVATAVAMEHVEFARTLTWTELQMTAVDEGSPALATGGTALDAAATGLEADETLVVDAAGLVTAFEQQVIDGTTYDVWRHVSSAPGSLRRFLVVVEWDSEGSARSFQSSTLVSEVSTR